MMSDTDSIKYFTALKNACSAGILASGEFLQAEEIYNELVETKEKLHKAEIDFRNLGFGNKRHTNP